MARIKLVVTQPFGDFSIGDEISDAVQVSDTRDSHPHYVVAVEVEDDPPAKAAPPADKA